MNLTGDHGIPPDLVAWMNSRPPPAAPSRRKPDQDWFYNEADKIERVMQADRHITWGFVIFRTTYESEDDWNEFISRLRFRLERTFDACNGRDILDAFTLTTFSDQGLLDGADTSAIRSYFERWAQTAYLTEQRPQQGQATSDQSGSAAVVEMGRSPRYHFCIQVDKESILSVVRDAPAPPAPDPTKKGWVKLINKLWNPIEDDDSDVSDQGYDPIEGITERDVGWMRVPYTRVMLNYYSGSEEMNGWRSEYCRPPEVVGPPWD